MQSNPDTTCLPTFTEKLPQLLYAAVFTVDALAAYWAIASSLHTQFILIASAVVLGFRVHYLNSILQDSFATLLAEQRTATNSLRDHFLSGRIITLSDYTDAVEKIALTTKHRKRIDQWEKERQFCVISSCALCWVAVALTAVLRLHR
jgi:hypothetical protein